MRKEWSSLTRIIGFVGSDKAEIILYLSKILTKLDKRVLIQDLSETKALSYCVNSSSQELEDIITYYQADFTNINELQTMVYDFILVDFGFNLKHPDIKKCNEIWILTDPQIHHVMALKDLKLEKEQKRILIIKDYVHGKITPKYIMKELEEVSIASDPYKIYWDQEDWKQAVNCQYNNMAFFDKLSLEYLDLFAEQLEESGITKKQLKKAFKRVGRGK